MKKFGTGVFFFLILTCSLFGGGRRKRPLNITTSSLPNGTQGQSYSAQLNASGGSTPYTWSLTTLGTALPTGLSLNSGGAITGTPTQSGTFAPNFKVVDSSTPQQSAVATLDIFIAASISQLTITTTSLPNGTQGQAYPSTQLNASGGTAPYSWSGSSLPPGLSLSNGGVLSGTPTQAGTFSSSFQVSDSSSPQQSASTVINIQIATNSGSGSCTLYVSPSGSDSNSGTSSSSPWQTVQKAFDGSSAGQTVCFMAGTYPIASVLQNGYSQVLNNSGTSSSEIVFTNYPGQVAIIHGNTRINGSYAVFQGTPLSFPYGLVFEGPTGQALDLIDVMNTHDVTFDHVEMRNDDYHAGIYQQNGYNLKILGCYIHDNGRFSAGTTYINTDHGIYWAATSGSGNLIANNLIEHNLAMGMQLYSGGSSTTPSNVVVEENTFVDNGNYGMVVWGESNFIVNNIFSGNGSLANNPQLNIYTSTNHVIDSNIFWSSISSHQGYANQTGQIVTHVIIQDPLFVGPSSNDFQLQSNSPAINVANTGYQQTTDILGIARTSPNLGAYEQ